MAQKLIPVKSYFDYVCITSANVKLPQMFKMNYLKTSILMF